MRGRVVMSSFAAGLITIMLVSLVCWLAWGRRLPWQDDFEIRAVVPQANELHGRSPVRIAGVEVGRVKKIERGPGSTAIVTMAIEPEGRPIRRDARVKVRPRIFLEGNFFVDLEPGSPSEPELEDGGTIPLASTAAPVQLDQILSALRSDTRQNLKHLLRGLGQGFGGGGARALNRSLDEWEPAFSGAAQSAEAARGQRDGDLAGFVRDGGRAAAALGSDERALAELVTGLNRTLRALAVRRERLDQVLPALDQLVREAGPSFAALQTALPPARELVSSLRPGLREAPATLEPTVPLLRELRGLLGSRELAAAERELTPAVATLANLEPELEELFGLLTPVTDCVLRNALPTLTAKVDDDHLSSGQPVYRSLLYTLPGLASASQNFDGNGPAVRYHAGFGEQMVTLGRLPGTNEPLVGFTSEPILGSRPKRPAEKPPFRPDVPCLTQDPPDLRAQTGPAPEQEPVPAQRVKARRR